MSIDISVIVPIYNVAAYLPRCLRSLAAQRVDAAVEFVLVDDGSSDESGRICDEFAAANGNARVIHKKNGGVSSARNAGLDAAQGTYTAFLDGDDFLRADALAIALDAMRRGADGVFFRYASVQDDEEVARPDAPEEIWLEGPQVHLALLEHREGLLENVFKVLRRASIGAARFPENVRCGEDAMFLFEALRGVRRAVIPAQTLYFYRVRPGSIMRSLRPEVLDQRIFAHEEVERISRETWPETAETAQARTMFMRLYILNDMMDNPNVGDAACFRRHVRGLRRNLGALLKNRSRVWLPASRKVYALALCLCPGAARLLHKRRVRQRGKQ